MADTTSPRSSLLLEILKLPAVQMVMLAVVSVAIGSVGTVYSQQVVTQLSRAWGAVAPTGGGSVGKQGAEPTMRDLHALVIQAAADAGYCAKHINQVIDRLPNPLRPPQMPVVSPAKK
jgi:hypothetical protein